VHRDIKPQNIVIGAARDRPVLVDFGLARDVPEDGEMFPLAGTPLYMAPEAIRGAAPSYASDRFALGCVLYEMFAGKPPFMARAVDHVFQQILHENPASLSTFAPELPSSIAKDIELLLAKKPEARLESLDRLRLRLEEVAKRRLLGSDFPLDSSLGRDVPKTSQDSSTAAPNWARRVALGTIATTFVTGIGYLASKRLSTSDSQTLPSLYVPPPIKIPERPEDEEVYIYGNDTSAMSPQFKNVIEVEENLNGYTMYWAPTRPNEWGEIFITFRRLRTDPVECAMLGLTIWCYSLFDPKAEAKLWARGDDKEWKLLAELQPRTNGIQTAGADSNVTELIGRSGLEVLLQLKASRRLKLPVPQEVPCYAAAQCLRRGKRDFCKILRIWYKQPESQT